MILDLFPLYLFEFMQILSLCFVNGTCTMYKVILIVNQYDWYIPVWTEAVESLCEISFFFLLKISYSLMRPYFVPLLKNVN